MITGLLSMLAAILCIYVFGKLLISGGGCLLKLISFVLILGALVVLLFYGYLFADAISVVDLSVYQ